MTSEMVERAWASTGHFRSLLHPEIRTLVRRLERLFMKIFKKIIYIVIHSQTVSLHHKS